MTGYIFGVVLYLVVGYILSLGIGFSIKAGDGWNIILCMVMWPIAFLVYIVWLIEDVLMCLHEKNR